LKQVEKLSLQAQKTQSITLLQFIIGTEALVQIIAIVIQITIRSLKPRLVMVENYAFSGPRILTQVVD
jgi:hypothetical protein